MAKWKWVVSAVLGIWAQTEAFASKPIPLGVCEGAADGETYLIRLLDTKVGRLARVYRVESRAGGDEWHEEIGGPIRFHDDSFEDAGEITHHLIDEGMSHEDADEAALHVVYRAGGEGNAVPARIRLFGENGDPLELREASCTLTDADLKL